MTPDAGKAPVPRDTRRSPRRRHTLAAVAVLAGGAIALTACGGHGSGTGKAAGTVAPSPSLAAGTTAAAGPGPAATAAQAASATTARITITPASGTAGAPLHNAARVTVTGGTLTSVTMTARATGNSVAGTMSADRTTWTPDGALARGTQYQISAAATDATGRATSAQTTFATISAANSFIGYFTPEDGSTVGVGMPVSINFDKAISQADRAAVQKAVTVTSTSGQRVVGHWFSPTRLDLRPQTYWQAGSHVSLNLRLDGVEGSAGVYGVQDKTVNFTVGRSQVSTVDAQTHQMTVVRDGKVIRTIAVSAGAPGAPGNRTSTYNGQMVISEKDQTTRMNAATVGLVDSTGKSQYDIPDVPHAMRLTTSGTFIHGNYWAAKSVFGTVNTSHGCIGMSDTKGGNDPNTPAAWFYDNSMIGDVVVVKNSPDKTVPADNGLNGWNLTWSQWLAGSAVG